MKNIGGDNEKDRGKNIIIVRNRLQQVDRKSHQAKFLGEFKIE